MRRRSAILSLALLLAVMSLHVPPVQAQTPTPTLGPSPTPSSFAGYFWIGEGLQYSYTITGVSPSYTDAGVQNCATYGGYVAASMMVVSGTDGTVTATIIHRTAANATLSTSQRRTIGPGKLIYVVQNSWFTIPSTILDAVVLAYTNATTGSEAYIDTVNHAPAVNVSYRGSLITATVGYNIGINTLCYVPPPPVATATMTPTPADVLRATTTSGAQYNLSRTVTYGDLAVSIAVLTLVVVLLGMFFLWSPRLRL